MKLSVIICAYNERQTILDAIHHGGYYPYL